MLKERVEELLIKNSKKTKTLQFAMNLPALGVNYSFSSTLANQRFHSASVGKLMTATLIFVAIEQGKTDPHSPIICSKVRTPFGSQ